MNRKREINKNISLKRFHRLMKKEKIKDNITFENKIIQTDEEQDIEKKSNFVKLEKEEINYNIKDNNLNINIYKLKLFEQLLEINNIKFNNYNNYNKNKINKFNDDLLNINLDENNEIFFLDDFSIILRIKKNNNKIQYKLENKKEKILIINEIININLKKNGNNYILNINDNKIIFKSNIIKYFFLKKINKIDH